MLTSASAAGATPLEHDEQKYSAWQSNQHSFYVSSASDVGVIYARPQLTLGWGAPFWNFFGIDAYGLATNEFSAAYVGWRASLPFLDVQLGRRWNYAYDRRFLPPRDEYEAKDLELIEGATRSKYQVMELEVTPLAPVLHGAVFVEFHPIWIDAPNDRYVFEEVTRVVAVPPFVMRTRLGYVYGVGASGDVKAGAMVEYLIAPGRPQNTTRVGPLLLASFTKHFEGLFTWTVVVDGPDKLGVYAGSYGFLGVRYRFAERF